MAKERKRKTVKRSTLTIAMAVALGFSMLIGVIGIARGVGSIYPQLNFISKPFVCAGGEMSYARSVSSVGSANYYAARWFCSSDKRENVEIDPNSVFVSAGLIYGLVFFVLLLAISYVYWNSRIGPAKNGGPDLW